MKLQEKLTAMQRLAELNGQFEALRNAIANVTHNPFKGCVMTEEQINVLYSIEGIIRTAKDAANEQQRALYKD